jgi:hypothetical protein
MCRHPQERRRRGLSDLPSEWDLARPSIPGISIDRHLIPLGLDFWTRFMDRNYPENSELPFPSIT